MDHAQLAPGGTKNTLAGGATNWAHQPSTHHCYRLHPCQYPLQFQVACWSAAAHHLVSFSAQQGAKSLLIILLSLPLPLSLSFVVAIWRLNSIFWFVVPLLSPSFSTGAEACHFHLVVLECCFRECLAALLCCHTLFCLRECVGILEGCASMHNVLLFWQYLFHSAVFLICRLILYSLPVVLLYILYR